MNFEMQSWQPYLIALVIGLLVGIEREKAHPVQKAMGVRTFLMVSLLGALAGGLSLTWLAVVLAAFTMGLILVSYFNQTREAKADRGLTTEFAAAIVFCLGYIAHEAPTLSAVVGPIVALILFSKPSLHRFTQVIKPSELEAALLLLLAGVVVVNLVPDRAIDPLEIFNPKKFGFLILTLATLEFLSYVLAKVIGQKKGSLVVGFLGGLVSSTAVVLAAVNEVKRNPKTWPSSAASVLAAKLAALVELVLIVGFIAPALLPKVALVVGAAGGLGAVLLFFIAKKSERNAPVLNVKSPLDWKGVFRLSLLFALLLASISLAKTWLGETASATVSFLTGLFELHGVSLANATLFTQGQTSAQSATNGIILAICASLVAKVGIILFTSKGTFARILSLSFAAMTLTVLLLVYLV